VACFNDSKSTTPAATLRALESFEDLGRVHLIAGGYDKRIDLSGIARLAGQLAGLYAIGQVQESLATDGGTCCGDLGTAVRMAFERARPGDSILLSPACASTDQYPNFEHRGEHFVRLVRTTVAAPSR
jgi:UDP-N-acetylmuramoylalanine--D-glutamate ligase